MIILRIFLAVAVTTLAVGACTPPEPIRIGFIGGLSGRVSDLGIGGLQGARLAVELKNKVGGIEKHPVELIEVDDQQNPDAALKAFDKLVSHRVAAVVGPMTSDMAMAIVPRANKEKLLVVSPTVSSNELDGLDDYFFRLIPATRHFVRANADYYFNTLGLRRIRLVYDLGNKSYSESWFGDFTRAVADSGGTLLAPISFTSGDDTRFTELAQKALEDKPEAIIAISNSVDAAMLFQSIRKLNSTVRLGASQWAATERLAELGGRWVEGVVVAHFFDRTSKQAAYLDFKSAYQNRFGREPGFAELFGFDATNVVLEAIEKRGKTKSLKEAVLAQRTYRGTQAQIVFDDNGDSLVKTYLFVIKDGRFVPVEP